MHATYIHMYTYFLVWIKNIFRLQLLTIEIRLYYSYSIKHILNRLQNFTEFPAIFFKFTSLNSTETLNKRLHE